jgi:large subunit ribosomal protein L4e
MSRPIVTVQSPSGKFKSTVPFPFVFHSPIRVDIVNDVHTKMNKNHRQPYAVSRYAGADTSAQSWGTGRAVSRIPRVSGGGTHRSGQGAFGNMCRGGRMFAPTKVWRKWHIKISKDQRRYATCAALAASAVAPLVLARGHAISQIAEVPLVVADNDIEIIAKTKEAVKFLKSLGVGPELKKVQKSRHIRAGKGKARGRKYVQKKGPLIIHDKKRDGSTIQTAFRNVPGIELCNVHRLNLLTLAPGGHVGRFIIWTESAFKALNSVFGTRKADSTEKKGYKPPRAIMHNSDLARIINSPEVQAASRDKIIQKRKRSTAMPFGSKSVRARVSPLSVVLRRQALLGKKSPQEKSKALQKKRQLKKQVHKKYPRKAFLKLLLTPSIAPVRSAAEKGILATQQ